MNKVKSGLGGLTIAQTVLSVNHTLTMMNGNPNFPNPPYPVIELKADNDSLSQYEQAFRGGDRKAKAPRDQTLITVRTKMTLTSSYVNSIANGDLAKLQSSGFELAKTPTPAAVPGKVQKITCTNEPESGTCHINWSGVKDRSFYVVQFTYTPEDSNSWMEVEHVTAINCKAYGLTTGSWAYFRVCAVNRAGRGEWSAEMKLMVS